MERGGEERGGKVARRAGPKESKAVGEGETGRMPGRAHRASRTPPSRPRASLPLPALWGGWGGRGFCLLPLPVRPRPAPIRPAVPGQAVSGGRGRAQWPWCAEACTDDSPSWSSWNLASRKIAFRRMYCAGKGKKQGTERGKKKKKVREPDRVKRSRRDTGSGSVIAGRFLAHETARGQTPKRRTPMQSERATLRRQGANRIPAPRALRRSGSLVPTLPSTSHILAPVSTRTAPFTSSSASPSPPRSVRLSPLPSPLSSPLPPRLFPLPTHLLAVVEALEVVLAVVLALHGLIRLRETLGEVHPDREAPAQRQRGAGRGQARGARASGRARGRITGARPGRPTPSDPRSRGPSGAPTPATPHPALREAAADRVATLRERIRVDRLVRTFRGRP